MAKEGEANIELPITHFDNLDFSFSGIKTAVINLNHKTPDLNKADLCASFEKAATQMLLNNIKKSIEIDEIDKIVLAGGVSANSYIRKEFDEFSKEKNIEVLYPELKYCTDNAAMIASAGYFNFLEGKKRRIKLKCCTKFKIRRVKCLFML